MTGAPRLLDRLQNRVSAKRTRSDDASGSPAPYYVRLDNGTVDVFAHAIAAARENLPASDATEPNDAETAMQREHERLHVVAVEAAQERLQDCHSRFDQTERLLPAPRDLKLVVEKAQATIIRDLAADQLLVSLWRTRQALLAGLRAFKLEHGLHCDAHYPADPVHHLALVVVMLVFESLVNAAFFARSSERGLVGGILLAGGVSFANGGAGILAGYFPGRWINLRRRAIRWTSWTLLALYSVFAIGFNLAVAWARDAGTMSLRTTPGGTLSLPSIALLVLGIVVSAMAFWKGQRADDAFPGFGQVDRVFVAADQALTEHRTRLVTQVLSRIEVIPTECAETIRTTVETLEELDGIVGETGQIFDGYDAHVSSLELRCHQVLQRYRAINTHVRSSPPPEYFRRFPALSRRLDRQVVEDLQERLETARQRLEELRATAHEIGLGQAQRMSAARDQFGCWWADGVRRADAGRGHIGDAVETEPERGGVA